MSQISIDLSKDIAVVTGAGSGIGAAIARTLAAAGASVVAADIDEASALATASAIVEDGGSAEGMLVDITIPESVTELRRRVEARFGSTSIVVNNAGWGKPGEMFVDNTPEFWNKVVAINFMGPIAVTRAFLDPMIERGDGKIVNISSDAGRVGSMGETIYAGAKGGIIAFTKSLAREVARHGIRVNCVCPGPTDTPFFQKQAEKLQVALVRATPLRRLARPDEMSGAVAYFASDLSSFVTGQVLSVSGGLTMAG